MKKIVIASGNTGKINEFRKILHLWPVTLIPQSTYNVLDIEETGLSFIENALLKARHCSTYTTHPVLADDSGLCIDKLSSRPGIYSSRYGGIKGDNQKNIIKILDELQLINGPFHAHFYCALVLLRGAKDQEPLIATGTLRGEITQKALGQNGLGYDPIFYLPKHNKTLAQLDSIIKNKISHRARALSMLRHMIIKAH